MRYPKREGKDQGDDCGSIEMRPKLKLSKIDLISAGHLLILLLCIR